MSSTPVKVYRTLKFDTNKCYAYTDKKLGKGVTQDEVDPTIYYAKKEDLEYLGKYVKTETGHGGSDGSNAYNHFNNNGKEREIGYDYNGDSTWFVVVKCKDLSSACSVCSVSGGTRNKKRKNRKSIRRKTNRRKSKRSC